MSKSNILFLMTGSIACYKACHVVSRLVQAGHTVQVVASPSALQFVGAATLEGLTGRAVVSDLWEKGRAMDHIHLIRQADLILAAPASAHFINRIAYGLGDDLLTTLFLAHDFKKPFLIAPAMNTSMYLNPATQESLRRLRGMGVEILEAASGVLACGETGYGKLLEPDLILKEVFDRLSTQKSTIPNASVTGNLSGAPAAKVLITSGGTREKIDDVRFITNMSTGKSGARLAESLSSLGLDVTLLHAEGAATTPDTDVEHRTFNDVTSLQDQLRTLIAKEAFTHVIHMAAVSDFLVSQINGQKPGRGKISSGENLTLQLSPAPKLIAELRSYAGGRPLKVAGFKLTSGAETAARKKAADKILEFADLVIGNDLSDISPEVHPYVLYSRSDSTPLAGFPEMSAALAQWISEKGPLV